MSEYQTDTDNQTIDITENRLCHLRRPNTCASWCGVKTFTPETAHTVEECQEYHTQCVVCQAVKEWESWQ